MAFWSGQRLDYELRHRGLVEPFDPEKIDCAAYTLTIGDEVYVSPTERSEAFERTVRPLTEREAFTIPPGQFAFLLTKEIVRMPRGALGFISMKAGVKFLGLVNVSGFHVDPGYEGRLVFAVYNASPTTIHLRQGDDCFLIWYADLDSGSDYIKKKPGWLKIESSIVSNISGEFKTIEAVSNQLEDVTRNLDGRLTKVEGSQSVATGLLIALIAGIGLVVLQALWPNALHPSTPPSAPTPVATITPSISAPRTPRPLKS